MRNVTTFQREPDYKYHQTVLFSIAYPDMVVHQKSNYCDKEYPHTIDDCGEFIKKEQHKQNNSLGIFGALRHTYININFLSYEKTN